MLSVLWFVLSILWILVGIAVGSGLLLVAGLLLCDFIWFLRDELPDSFSLTEKLFKPSSENHHPETSPDLWFSHFWDMQADWSRKTFGSDGERGPIGPLKHLEKEAREAYEEKDLEKLNTEIADCQFLVFDAARRSGMTFDSLLATCFQKLAINQSRSWPKPTSDEPVEHVRGEE